MHRRLLAVMVGAIIVAAVAGFGVSGMTTVGAQEPPTLAQTGPDGFDDTVFEITLFANGDARWMVEHSRPLENETDFENFAERFQTEELDVYQRFQVRAGRLTQQGSNVTGREMNATAFERDADIDELGQRRGVITMSFRWANFAPVENETVVVGDLFAGGFAITDSQRLRLRAGDGVVFSSVDPPPDSMSTPDDLAGSSTVTWIGEREFADNRPRTELVPASRFEDRAADTTTDGDGTTTDGDTTDGGTADTSGGATGDEDSTGDGTDSEESPSGIGMVSLAVGGILVLLVLGGAVAWYARRDEETVPNELAPEAPEPAESPVTPGPAPAPTEEELLTDEDRVINLLEDNDGRMQQVEIVERTDWSKSKVSMLLSDMEEEGHITKLRVGRENIISLAGEEPDAAGSPFDNE